MNIRIVICSHKLQHFTNQLAKDTSSLLKGLTDLPPSLSKSEQVRVEILEWSQTVIGLTVTFTKRSGWRLMSIVIDCVFIFQRHCKLHRERLMNEFASALNNFQLSQRRQKDLEHESIFKVRSHLSVRAELDTIQFKSWIGHLALLQLFYVVPPQVLHVWLASFTFLWSDFVRC